MEATFRDLRRAPEGGLENLARQSRRGAEVITLYRRFRSLTADTYDAEDAAHAAARAVRDGGGALRDIGHAILYLPRALSPGEEELVRELDKRDGIDVILGIAHDALADREPIDLAGRLGKDIPADALGDAPLHATSILRAVDTEEEVRSVIRLIVDEVARGTPLHRIGVLFSATEAYATVLAEQFRAAGVPVHGPPTRPLANSLAGRALLGMLSLPASEFRREAVMDWLTSGPIVETWEGEDRGRWAPGPQWDEISRDAGIVKGIRQWEGRLAAWSKQPRTRVARGRIGLPPGGVYCGAGARPSTTAGGNLDGAPGPVGARTAGPVSRR